MPPEFEPVVIVYADVLEAHGNTQVVALTQAEYQRAVARLGHHVQVKGTPQEAAQALLQAMPEEELLAEVNRGRVLTLVPLSDKGALVPEAEAALKEKYLRWCERRGGGDCLSLFTDGPYLRTDDRRTLALALAFGTVLDETRAALGRELSPQAILSTVGTPPGHTGTIDIQHLGGNRQIVLANGQRWHLPRGKDLHDIPAEDKLGDELQAAAERIARGWGEGELSNTEKAAIERARDVGNETSARHLEGLARGRWVNAKLKEEFPQLEWSPRGIDAVDPRPGGLKYEVLSGTRENFAVHGRRMATEFFRMIFF
jgi:hypothetical protein